MTRFNISLNEGVDLVLHAMENAWGGEIFVPKIPSYRILDLAKAIAPNCKLKLVGIRPGEKIHEEMITAADSFNTYEIGSNFVILPSISQWDKGDYIKSKNAKLVPKGFNYSSGKNPHFLTVEELRKLIVTNLDIEL